MVSHGSFLWKGRTSLTSHPHRVFILTVSPAAATPAVSTQGTAAHTLVKTTLSWTTSCLNKVSLWGGSITAGGTGRAGLQTHLIPRRLSGSHLRGVASFSLTFSCRRTHTEGRPHGKIRRDGQAGSDGWGQSGWVQRCSCGHLVTCNVAQQIQSKSCQPAAQQHSHLNHMFQPPAELWGSEAWTTSVLF